MSLLTIEHVSKAYGEKVIFDDISCGVQEGDKIGIVGINGTGKTTLLRILAGVELPDEGQLVLQNNLHLTWLPQNPEFPRQESVLSYVMDQSVGDWNIEGEAKNILNRLGFSDYNEDVTHLSGGQKKRVALARAVVNPTDVLILDEPTNDLDIRTLMILEDYLDTFPGIVIAVSHDRYFLDRVVRRIFAFGEDGRLCQYEGGYTDYQAALSEKQAEEEANSGSRTGRAAEAGGKNTDSQTGKSGADWKQDARMKPKKLKFTYQEQKDFETIEAEISQLEEQIGEKEAAIEAAVTDYGALNRLMEEKEGLEKELEAKMERWMYLEELAARIEAGETV